MVAGFSLLAWVVLGFTTASLAHTQGRRRIPWTLAAVVLFPFAAPIFISLVLLPPGKLASNKVQHQDKRFWVWTLCGLAATVVVTWTFWVIDSSPDPDTSSQVTAASDGATAATAPLDLGLDFTDDADKASNAAAETASEPLQSSAAVAAPASATQTASASDAVTINDPANNEWGNAADPDQSPPVYTTTTTTTTIVQHRSYWSPHYLHHHVTTTGLSHFHASHHHGR